MKKIQKYFYPALMIFFATVFLVSATVLIVYYINSNKQAKQNNELANMVEQIQQQLPSNGSNANQGTANHENANLNEYNVYTEVTHPLTGELMNILSEYAPIFQMNADMVGWIKIPGTKINYPVVQTPDAANYYLKRDFYKQNSRHGTIYANELADIFAHSSNITLYGHNMGDGSMFAALHQYANKDFYDGHAYINFDTLTSHQTYKIIAVFETTDDWKTGFAYHEFVDGSEWEFHNFITECKTLSLYDTGETAVYGDKLLTLSTCDNNLMDDHGRFVVVAKKVSL